MDACLSVCGVLVTYTAPLFLRIISAKMVLPALATLGLLAGRLAEAAGTLGAGFLTGTRLLWLPPLFLLL